MSTITADQKTAPFIASLRQLQKIRNFEGEPSEFWPLFIETLIGLAQAEAGMICLRAGNEDSAQWKTLAMGPQNPAAVKYCKILSESITAAAKACVQSGFAYIPGPQFSIIAINLLIDVDIHKCLAIFYLNTTDKNEAILRINSLLSANDIPAQYRVQQSAYDALKKQSHLTDILDLLTLMNSQQRYIAAAMTACNELATRYNCDRVSLGWLKKGYVRIAVMSNTDQFNKKMEAVSQLELAMEESLDQETDLVIPAPESSHHITRDHLIYAKAHDVQYMATLPLRKKDQIIALFSFERSTAPFDESELCHLRVTIDQLTIRLTELQHRDRWFGARLFDWLRNKASLIVGYEHTWVKLIGILSGIALIIITLIPVRYRVDSPMILRTDDVAYITTPFDGYIDSVKVKPGDLVDSGRTMLTIDKKDLLLEESSLLAEKNREQREIDKARAAGELANMCISQARFDQVQSKLEINNYKLEQAGITSPFNGVIIEGDQKEKIGSPIKQGEILFKIGRIKNIYAEAKVSEAEIQNIKMSARGQIALASRPQNPFDITVTLIEPSAVVNEKDNVFLVRCKLGQTVPPWFRPGMTGISKINAGHKTILWIISHRTIDFIRLKLWW